MMKYLKYIFFILFITLFYFVVWAQETKQISPSVEAKTEETIKYTNVLEDISDEDIINNALKDLDALESEIESKTPIVEFEEAQIIPRITSEETVLFGDSHRLNAENTKLVSPSI